MTPNHLIDAAQHAAREQQRHMDAERAMQGEILRLRQGLRDALGYVRFIDYDEEAFALMERLEALLGGEEP